jgi:hypothetical protein
MVIRLSDKEEKTLRREGRQRRLEERPWRPILSVRVG